MLVLPHNCQCSANFQIGNNEVWLVSASCQDEAFKRRLKLSSEAGGYSHQYAFKMESGNKNATLNPVEDPAGLGTFEPMNGYNNTLRAWLLYQKPETSNKQLDVLLTHWFCPKK